MYTQTPKTDFRSTWAWKEKIYLVAKTPGSLFAWHFTVTEPPTYIPLDANEDPASHAGSESSGKLGFEPLPLAMRPNAPYNVQPMGVIIDQLGRKRRRGKDDDEKAEEEQVKRVEKRQYPEMEEFIDGARVMIGFQRSAVLGLGSVFCWVDDDRGSGRRVEGWWEIEERNMGM